MEGSLHKNSTMSDLLEATARCKEVLPFDDGLFKTSSLFSFKLFVAYFMSCKQFGDKLSHILWSIVSPYESLANG